MPNVMGLRRSSFTVQRSPFNVQHSTGDRTLAQILKIGTADSTDFTDFKEVIGGDRTNLFVAKRPGVSNRKLLYL
jgi:hypothetical protein